MGGQAGSIPLDGTFLGTDIALDEPWHLIVVFFFLFARLFGGVMLFSWRVPKKPHFVARAAGVVALLTCIYTAIFKRLLGLALPSAGWSYVVVYACFSLLLFLSYAPFLALFEASTWTALFCTTAGYTISNLATGVTELAATVQRFVGVGPSAPGVYLASNALALLVVYGGGCLLVAPRIDHEGLVQMENREMLVMMPVVSLAIIGFDVVIKALDGSGLSLVLSIILRILHGLACVSVLWSEHQMLFRSRLEHERKVTERLLAEHERQLRFSQQNIEAINIKCHDLRHQIRALSSGGAAVDGTVLEDLARAVRMYDSSVQTGNQALDTILTEKRLLCESRHITLTCIADGEALGMMAAADIYSLFGNALDNAIEAVGQLDDAACRSITLVVRQVMGCASVHVENYCAAAVALAADGLPVTTKKDQVNHGFGTRSMQAIAKKYGGTFSVKTGEDTFAVDVMIPLA